MKRDIHATGSFDISKHKRNRSSGILLFNARFIFTCTLLGLLFIWVLFENTQRRHQMETFSALLAICAGNSSVTGEFPAQMPVTRSFDVFFDLRLNKRLSKQSWGWWFETPSHPLWRHCNVSSCPPRPNMAVGAGSSPTPQSWALNNARQTSIKTNTFTKHFHQRLLDAFLRRCQKV